jgi:hypothetical protein
VNNKLLIIFLLLIFSKNIFAFTLSNSVAAAFPEDEVTINLASHTCDNLGITNEELLDLAMEGVDQFWNLAPISRLNIKRGEIIDVSSEFQTGSICNNDTSSSTGVCSPNSDLKVSSNILISCNQDSLGNNFKSSAIIAVSIPNNISNRDINGALILINDTADNIFKNKDRETKIAILAHEIGHAIGLGHSKHKDSLMYYTTVPTRESLGEDDLDGIAYLYPMNQPFGTCGTISTSNNNKNLFLSLLLGVIFIVLIRRLNFK